MVSIYKIIGILVLLALMAGTATGKECGYIVTNDVDVISIDEFASVGSVTLDGQPSGQFLGQDKKTLYVIVPDSIHKIDLETMSSEEIRISAGNNIAISPDGARLYSATGSVIQVTDLASGTVLEPIVGPEGATFGEMEVSPDGTKLYTACFTGDKVCLCIVDLTSPAYGMASIPIGYINDILLSPDGKAYVAGRDAESGRGIVLIVDSNNDVSTSFVPTEFRTLTLTEDGSKLYAGCYGWDGGAISVMNTADNSVKDIAFATGFVGKIAINHAGTRAYAPVSGDAIYIFDVTNNLILGRIPVNEDMYSPTGIGITADDRKLVIISTNSDGQSSSVTVVDADSLATINHMDLAMASGIYMADVKEAEKIKITDVVISAKKTKKFTYDVRVFADNVDDQLETVINWGDGTEKKYKKSPMLHTYKKAAVYDIKVTILDKGQSDSMTKQLKIDAQAVIPVADFTANVTNGSIPPLCVQFTDTSANNPTAWAWFFGDGGTSTEKNPVHVYQKVGTYHVALIAENSAGSGMEIKMGYITVGNPNDRTGRTKK